MNCNKCNKRVRYPSSLTWTRFHLCPKCYGDAPNAATNKDLIFKDDTIFRIEVNPVDMYWDKMTQRELLNDIKEKR